MKSMLTKLIIMWTTGGFLGKLKITITAGILATPIFGFIEKYVYSNWEFAGYLFIMVTLDTILGIWKSWKRKEISSHGFAQLFTKISLYALLLIVSHVISSFSQTGISSAIFSWLSTAIYSAMIVREAISIFEKVGAISPNLIPKWILKRLKQFDDTGKFKEDEKNIPGVDQGDSTGKPTEEQP